MKKLIISPERFESGKEIEEIESWYDKEYSISKSRYLTLYGYHRSTSGQKVKTKFTYLFSQDSFSLFLSRAGVLAEFTVYSDGKSTKQWHFLNRGNEILLRPEEIKKSLGLHILMPAKMSEVFKYSMAKLTV